MNIVKFSIIAAALFALLLTAGCDPQANGGSSSASLSSASSASSSSTEAQKAEDDRAREIARWPGAGLSLRPESTGVLMA